MPNKVMIAVPTGEFARRAIFYDFFNAMEKPVGSVISFAHGQSPAKNRNLMIQQALQHECTHILFLDDDVLPKADLLSKLLNHNKDLVTGLYFMRNYPHRPIIFDYADEEGKCRWHYLSEGEIGLIEVVATGLGCILIKTDVFRNMEEPWIRLGEIESDMWCDDTGFFKRVREKGYKIYCDLSATVGHMATCTIVPEYREGKWFTVYDTTGEGQINAPQLERPKEEPVEAPKLELVAK